MAEPIEINEEFDTFKFRDGNRPSLNLVYWTRASSSPSSSTIPSEQPKILFWLHGIGEHVGRVKPLAKEFLSRCPGLDAVMSFDLRGHGKSEGERGVVHGIADHIEDARDYVLPQMALKYGTDAQILICGHSLGGLLAIGLGLSKDDFLEKEACGSIKGFFLSSPAIRNPVKGFTNRMLAPLANVFASFAVTRNMIKANEICTDHLSHDKKCVKEYENDELVHDKLSLGLAADMLKYGENVIFKISEGEQCLLTSELPTTIVHSPQDEITAFSGSRDLINALNKNGKGKATLVQIDNAAHEIFNELKECGREKFFESATTFFNEIFPEEAPQQ